STSSSISPPCPTGPTTSLAGTSTPVSSTSAALRPSTRCWRTTRTPGARERDALRVARLARGPHGDDERVGSEAVEDVRLDAGQLQAARRGGLRAGGDPPIVASASLVEREREHRVAGDDGREVGRPLRVGAGAGERATGEH